MSYHVIQYIIQHIQHTTPQFETPSFITKPNTMMVSFKEQPEDFNFLN